MYKTFEWADKFAKWECDECGGREFTVQTNDAEYGMNRISDNVSIVELIIIQCVRTDCNHKHQFLPELDEPRS